MMVSVCCTYMVCQVWMCQCRGMLLRNIYAGLEMCWCMSACASKRASPPSSQDMSGTIDALIGHLQDMGRLDAVNLMQIAVKEYGGSDSTSANSGPMLGG